MLVSAIQVKNVPDDLHEELRRRAEQEGVTVGEIVLRAVRAELHRETFREWAERVADLPLERRPTRRDVADALAEARGERRWDD
jgi:plasmid stability protein